MNLVLICGLFCDSVSVAVYICWTSLIDGLWTVNWGSRMEAVVPYSTNPELYHSPPCPDEVCGRLSECNQLPVFLVLCDHRSHELFEITELARNLIIVIWNCRYLSTWPRFHHRNVRFSVAETPRSPKLQTDRWTPARVHLRVQGTVD